MLTLWRPLSAFLPKCGNSHVKTNKIIYNHSGVIRPLTTNILNKYGYKIVTYKIGHGENAAFFIPGVLGCAELQIFPMTKYLDKTKFSIYTWDQPGYGESRPPERKCGCHSVDEEVDMIEAFMYDQGHKNYSQFGWSGGGHVALKLAVKRPDLINRLALLGTFSHTRDEDSQTFRSFMDAGNSKGRMVSTLVEYYGSEFFDREWNTWLNIFIQYADFPKGVISTEDLAKITCPTLITHGEKDLIVKPFHGHYLHDHIRNSKLIIWERGGHNVHLRFPEEYARVLQDFFLENATTCDTHHHATTSP